jgi:steroid delta-isomerase-like uncharacterized protein
MPDATAVEKTVRDSFEVVNSRDVQRFSEYWAEDCILTAPVAGTYTGLAGVRKYLSEIYAASSNWRLDVQHVVVTGSTAACEWRATGTVDGEPYQGMLATGKSFDFAGVSMLEIGSDLRAVRVAIYFDGDEFARQIGALPRRGSRADKLSLTLLNAKTRVARRTTRHK